MEDKKKRLEKMLEILIQLDEESLLLIDSGARLLVARQKIEAREILST